MDILQPLISVKSENLMVSGLMGRGFTRDQAISFLPEAGISILIALRRNEGILNSEFIISDIDISSIAAKTGIEASKVKDGLKFVLPGIIEQPGIADSGLLGKIKSSF